MDKHIARKRARRARYWRRTWRNKVSALALVAIGMVPVFIERDGTFLLLALMLGIPMFFSQENWIL